jgi:alkylation response protein AidB-like acyl-CoA dehydrogenase
MTSTSDALVARAAALVPMLREQAQANETNRRLSPEVFDALSEADVFRMTAPKRFGGFEADFVTQCEVLAEVARGCGSASAPRAAARSSRRICSSPSIAPANCPP